MDIFLPVIGGLALFLYGMNVMGDGLERAAGSKLSGLIEVLTSNKFMAIIVGAVVTMAVQSSSATTVMVIGFVNAGLMNLHQAAGVIMGANVGTTITAQIIAFDLTAYAPIAVAIGVLLWLGGKTKKIENIGEILIGFGILFIGMDMMSDGLAPLAHNPTFANIIVKLENPILGALAGMLLTTVLQSSSASIGLLQALAGQGLIGLNVAFPVLFGENIGTTTTALISSIGANVTAKRAAVIHFLFNVIGTILFMTILRKPVESVVLMLAPDNVQFQIAHAHTLFNIVNVLIQVWFIDYLVRAAEFLVPESEEGEMEATIYLDNRILETPSIALGRVEKEVVRMGNVVLKNLKRAEDVLVDENYDLIDEGLEQEELVNKIEREITEYLVKLTNYSLSEEQRGQINTLLYTINDFERVGDHVENMIELAQIKQEDNLFFSEEAKTGMHEMFDMCQQVLTSTIKAFETKNDEKAKEVMCLEDKVNILESKSREDHISRLSEGSCSTRSGLIYLDTISNLERVSDHCANIARYILDGFKGTKLETTKEPLGYN